MSKEERRAQRILEPGAPKRKLLEGSKQLTSHQGVLVRFHKFNMGVTVDIEEMLHQMFTRKEDRHSQRFLWRDDPSGTPDIYNMDVATFVLICSPASAQYIKSCGTGYRIAGMSWDVWEKHNTKKREVWSGQVKRSWKLMTDAERSDVIIRPAGLVMPYRSAWKDPITRSTESRNSVVWEGSRSAESVAELKQFIWCYSSTQNPALLQESEAPYFRRHERICVLCRRLFSNNEQKGIPGSVLITA